MNRLDDDLVLSWVPVAGAPGHHVLQAAAPEFVAEVDLLLSDPSKAETDLGWKRTIDLQGLVELMVDADLAAVRGVPGPPETAHLV